MPQKNREPYRMRTIVVDPDTGETGRVRVVRFRGWDGYVVKFTATCSGCSESNEGDMSHYPYDAKAHCYIGSGCEECGYTGKRREEHWMAFDEDAYWAWWGARWERRERLLEFWRRRRTAA